MSALCGNPVWDKVIDIVTEVARELGGVRAYESELSVMG